MNLSVILPTYNESGNIVDLVHAIMDNIPEGWTYEILVVDDDSPDHTYELVKETFASNPAVAPILRTTDRGLAKSIRSGLENARGERVLVMDTDFTHDPAEIPKMLHLAKVFDLVSGSRFCAGGSMGDTTHYVASLLYNWLIRMVLRTQIQDNLGGFFTTSREAVERLPYDAIFFGYGDYFFRLLHYAERQGLSILEMPTVYNTRKEGASKSNFLKLLFSYSRALISLKVKVMLDGRAVAKESKAIAD